MAWGTKNQIATSLAVTTTELFSSAVDLNPGESAHIQVVCSNGGVTDSLIISAYSTLDPSTEEWDSVPFFQQVLDMTSTPNEISLIISQFYKFRLGFSRQGSTDTLTVNAYERKDGINV